jgi:ATP-binding cassette subfamily B protein
MSNFNRFISYYKPHKTLFAANMLAALTTAVLLLALPLCVRHITDNILASGVGDVLPAILRTGALMVAIIAGLACSGTFNDWMGHVMGARIERGLRSELFAHYQRLPFGFYDGRNTGELMSRLTNDLFSISETFHHVPIMTLTYSLQFTGSVAILLFINWRLAVLIIAVLAVILLYAVTFYHKLQISYKINQERMADVNAAALENLSGIRDVKCFANEGFEQDKFETQNAKFYESRTRIYKSESLLLSIIEYFFTPLVTVVIVAAGGVWIAAGSLEVANLLVFVMYAAYLLSPVPKLAELIPFFQSGFVGFVRFREIMDIEPEIADADDAVDFTVTHGRVEFDNVSFRYGADGDYILHNVNIDVKAGEIVAVRGKSGIGKTTLCSLIPRLYDVCGGSIRIDGADIRTMTLNSLRKQIGVVRQETFLFAGTVMENIRYGKPGATVEEVQAAAKKANAHEFIINLPNGYDTDIGQRGVKLSGGQRQRLSIARVFLKNPPIIIFDEATNSLDEESEQAVLEGLYTLCEGRTAFIVTHRDSAVRGVDRVIELE